MLFLYCFNPVLHCFCAKNDIIFQADRGTYVGVQSTAISFGTCPSAVCCVYTCRRLIDLSNDCSVYTCRRLIDLSNDCLEPNE